MFPRPGKMYFNPRPPRGGRRSHQGGGRRQPGISIHAPREGGDECGHATGHPSRLFQSTPPARGATTKTAVQYLRQKFQSTPPARGATSAAQTCAATCTYFNPRPPRGGRRSTARGSTATNRISIHAPREGGDHRGRRVGQHRDDFNPRPPREGRRK